jgi:hypothetical protein
MKCKDCPYAWEEDDSSILVCHCEETTAPCEEGEDDEISA